MAGGKQDEMKGRVKEAAGKAKKKLDEAVDKVKDFVTGKTKKK